MAVTFKTTLLKAEDINATGISVPPEVIAALSEKKKPPVKVTLNSSYTYRTTVAAYGDVFMLPVSQEHRAAAGLKAGDQIEVTLELDTEPRTVEVPDDLVAALSAAGAKATFDGLAYSKRKEFVRQVEEAKTQETRERRIAKIIAQVSGS
jgi:hypothetical protein